MQREDESLSTRDLAQTPREVPAETAADPTARDAAPAEQDVRFDRRPADDDAQAGQGLDLSAAHNALFVRDSAVTFGPRRCDRRRR